MTSPFDPYLDTGHIPRLVDPGCGACGTCMEHDGCADQQNPLQPGDCETCGACRLCIEDCAERVSVEMAAGSEEKGEGK